MRTLKKIGMICVVIIAALFILPGAAHAASKDSLISRIEKKAGGDVRNSWYSDFDGDGKKELFAEVEDGNYAQHLWFASDKETKFLYDVMAEYSYNKKVNTVSKKQKLFIYELSAGGSGSTSLCYYVKSGKVKKVKKAGEALTHGKGKAFTVYMSAFDAYSDGTGHTYKAYYLKWTGSKFTEYKGKEISAAALKKYKGASDILKKAKNEGYSIDKIFKRGNGIINVNLHRYNSDYGLTAYDNLTLRVSGKSVKLVKVNEYYNNWIGKYSYGGKYKSAGF